MTDLLETMRATLAAAFAPMARDLVLQRQVSAAATVHALAAAGADTVELTGAPEAMGDWTFRVGPVAHTITGATAETIDDQVVTTATIDPVLTGDLVAGYRLTLTRTEESTVQGWIAQLDRGRLVPEALTFGNVAITILATSLADPPAVGDRIIDGGGSFTIKDVSWTAAKAAWSCRAEG